jgi:nucleoside-diphosphate-sugar epimerase
MLVFKSALAAGKGQTFKVVGKKETRLSTIHADDLADLYVRIADRVSSTRIHPDKAD